MNLLKSIFTVRGLKEHMSFREIWLVVTSQWRLFAALAVVAVLGSAIVYSLLRQYSASGTLVVHDSENSTLQAFSSRYFGDSKSFLDGKRRSSSLQKHTEYLRSMIFFESLALALIADKEAQESKGLNKIAGTLFNNEAQDRSLAAHLRRISQVQIDSDFAIRIRFSSAHPQLSTYLTNLAVEVAVEQLKAREMTELAQVQEFMEAQKKEADERYASALNQIATFQRRPENLVGLSSKEKLNEYVSELLIRINEIDLKISENEETVRFLRSQQFGQNAPGGVSPFGPARKIDEMVNENRMLRQRRLQVQGQINEIAESTKKLPQSADTIDEMRRKAELEFASFRELSAALAKLQIQKISIDNRFEVLELALPNQVSVKYPFPALALIGLLLAQIAGLFWIYIQYLLLASSNEEGRHSMPVIVDGNLANDPRFYVEDGQVRFRSQGPPATRESSRFGSVEAHGPISID